MTIRESGAHFVNRQLRRLGLRPRPPGESPRLDALKGAVATALSPLRRLRGQRG
jgi:hypothetical protein